jgi:penicillin-binding protein 2
MALAQTNEPGPDIRGILKNEFRFSTYDILNVPYQRIDQAIAQNLLELKWSTADTILTGIGQSVTLLTPIAVVRYIAALVNGGNVYDARLVKSIVSPDGQVVEEKRPQLIRTLDIPLQYTDAVKLGMKDVVSDPHGTAAKYFAGFKYLNKIGGKTGTAQVSQIDLENNAWFVAFAPYDQPEIAIAVYIKNGFSGGKAAYTAKEMVEYYLDSKLYSAAPETLPDANALTP